MITVDSVLQAALALSPEERLDLVDSIQASLAPDDLPFDPRWLEIVRKRSAEYDAGLVKSIPWEEVKEKIRQRAKEHA